MKILFIISTITLLISSTSSLNIFLESVESFLSHYKNLTQMMISFITLIASLGSVFIAYYTIHINQREKKESTKNKSKKILVHINDITYMDRMFVESRLFMVYTMQYSKFLEYKKEIEEEITNIEKKLEKINEKIEDIQYQKIEILTNNDIKKIIQKKEGIYLDKVELSRFNPRNKLPENQNHEAAIKALEEIINKIKKDISPFN